MTALITRGLDDEAIDSEELRCVVIAPSSSYRTIELSTHNRWENFPDPGTPLGSVSLSAWLDAVDAMTPFGPTRWPHDTRVDFSDPTRSMLYSRLINDLVSNLVDAIASTAADVAPKFSRLVGFFFALPGHGGSWVAVSHPSASLIMPVRANSESQWVGLHEQGLVFFSEPESHSDQEIRATEVDFSRIAKRKSDGDEITLCLIDRTAIESLEGRSTQLRGDDYGLPESEAVSARLTAHLARVPAEGARAEVPCSSFEAESLLEWLRGACDVAEALKSLAQTKPVSAITEALHEGAKRLPEEVATFADAANDLARWLIEQARYAEAAVALAPFDWMVGIARRAHCLWQLQRETEFAQLVAQADEHLANKGLQGMKRQNAEFYRKELVPFEALMVGRHDAARGLELARALTSTEGAAVRILLSAAGDIEAARTELEAQLAQGYPELAMLNDVKSHPLLGPMIAEYVRLKTQATTSNISSQPSRKSSSMTRQMPGRRCVSRLPSRATNPESRTFTTPASSMGLRSLPRTSRAWRG